MDLNWIELWIPHVLSGTVGILLICLYFVLDIVYSTTSITRITCPCSYMKGGEISGVAFRTSESNSPFSWPSDLVPLGGADKCNGPNFCGNDYG